MEFPFTFDREHLDAGAPALIAVQFHTDWIRVEYAPGAGVPVVEHTAPQPLK